MKILEEFKGTKTYLIALATIIYGISGMTIQAMNPQQGMQYVFIGLAAMGLRHAISHELQAMLTVIIYKLSQRQ